MIYDHMVKINGKYYEAGQDAPELEDMAEDEEPLPFSDTDIEFEENSAGKKYTRSEIIRMNKAELQELAKNAGMNEVENMTGTELKEHLLSVFEL